MKPKIKLIFKPYPEEIKGGQTTGMPYRCYDFSTDPNFGLSMRVEGRSQLAVKGFCVAALKEYVQEICKDVWDDYEFYT